MSLKGKVRETGALKNRTEKNTDVDIDRNGSAEDSDCKPAKCKVQKFKNG